MWTWLRLNMRRKKLTQTFFKGPRCSWLLPRRHWKYEYGSSTEYHRHFHRCNLPVWPSQVRAAMQLVRIHPIRFFLSLQWNKNTSIDQIIIMFRDVFIMMQHNFRTSELMLSHGMTVFQYMLTHLGRYSPTQLFGIPEPVSIVMSILPTSVIYTTVTFDTFDYCKTHPKRVKTKTQTCS